MKITSVKEYRDTLKAVKEFESHFDPKLHGKDCFILTNTASSSPPIVVLDETIADKMYAEGGDYTVTKGVIVGLDMEK